MAAGERSQSVDKTSEWEEFIEKLRKFHEERGTRFEAEPKIGQRRVDLLAMFKRVMQDGGYDKVSDKKLMPLQWKKVGEDLGLGKATHVTALAFQMKTVYYRHLAAYEIKTVHGKEPPPKEILEEVSARGGDLLNRTVENYPLARPVEEEDGDGTPNADKMEVDDPGSGRAMRGTRGSDMGGLSFSLLTTICSRLTTGTTTATAVPSRSRKHVSTNAQPRPALELAKSSQL